jgi:hypothetical protein
MTNGGIDDEDLPDDVNPEENPLAGGLDPGETAGDIAPGELLEEGKPADQSGDLGDDEELED